MLRHSRRVHFVGIGGTGMCGIAEVLLNLGYKVSGSDLAQNEAVFRLRSLGAEVTAGHYPKNVDDVDVVVYSSAVTQENVEVAEARRRKIPVIRRAEMLAELMRMKYSIAVAGTHGKTTTTSLVASVLAAGELDPTVVVGGRLNAIGANARLGAGEYLVAEADESDGTFLNLLPTITIVTNVDPEHLDFYGDFESLKKAFLEFMNKVPFYGFSVLCLDHPTIQEMIPQVGKRFYTYGFGSQADYVGENYRYREGEAVFTVRHRGEDLGEIHLDIPGRHNADNALAAVAVASELDVSFEAVQEGLRNFAGISRRMELVGEEAGIVVMDDYGHHPEEIRVTLRALREAWPDRRLVVLFQPHRYSRTVHLGESFHTAFYDSDVLFLAPIYAAGEEPIEEVDSRGIVEGVRAHGHKSCEEVANLNEGVRRLRERVRQGDLVLTLGAGDVWKVGRNLLNQLEGRGAEAEEAG
ncbi:UDP-N-acetylmuramate--L-alanine ligase [Nitrospinota bacterium]